MLDSPCHAVRTEYPRIVKHGSVQVKVYRVKQKTTATGWAYVVAWVSGGRRRLQQFAAESDAMEEARLKAAQVAEGRTESADLSREDRDDLVAAREICSDVPRLPCDVSFSAKFSRHADPDDRGARGLAGHVWRAGRARFLHQHANC